MPAKLSETSATTATAVATVDPSVIDKQTSKTTKKVISQDDADPKAKNRRSSTRKKATKKAEVASDSESDSDTEPVVLSDMDRDPVDGTTEFTLAYWDGSPPVPEGTIAKRFALASQEEQFRQASNLLKVTNDGRVNVKLQGSNWTPFLLTVPGAFRKVRVVYGAAVLETEENVEKLVVLHGEYIPGVAFPQAMELPLSALASASIKFPTGNEFGEKRKDKKVKHAATWFTTSKVKKLAYLPYLIPVPPCLVFDAFDQDMDAVVLYERWMIMRSQVEDTHNVLDKTIRSFLKAQLVLHSVRHSQGRLDIDVFLAGPPKGINEWTRTQIQRLVPPTKPVATATTPMAQASVQDIASAVVHAHHSYVDPNPRIPRVERPAPTEAASDNSATMGLSKTAFRRIMGMSGLSAGEEDGLQSIWFQLSEKLLTSTDKKVIVRTFVDNNVRYREAKVKLYYHLVKMIITRDFEEETTISCLRSAVKGLTPFAVPNLTDEETNRINEQAEALESATATTIKDVSASTIKLSVPASPDELTKRLKRFVNLLFVCFGEGCPMLKQVEYLVKDLEDYSDYARASMSRRTIASTIWLVHVQSRYFARGYMNHDSGRDETLPTFDVMSQCIMNRLPVVNGDVPPVLYMPPSEPRSAEPNSRSNPSTRGGRGERKRNRTDNVVDRDNKRFKIVQNPNYHQFIKNKMAGIVGDGRRLPRISMVCQKANTVAESLFPGRPELCIKATLYGTCFENCHRKHDLVSDPEAKSAMTKLQTVIENPSLVKVNTF